jgi:TolB protein
MKKRTKSYCCDLFFKIFKIFKKISLYGVCGGSCFLGTAAFANLTIAISQGQDKPYPIALIPFSSPDIPTKDLPNGFSEVILDDLGNSGRFSLLSQTAMPERPTQQSALHLSQWQKAAPQTEYAVMGSVKSDGENFDVTYSVVSLVNGDVLYGQHFDHIHTPQMRGLAHFIADKIYQTITGDRGYFSTRLAYVSVMGDTSENASESPIYRLVICDADGFNPRVLLQQVDNPIASPVWSPDGKFLAYVSYVHNRMAVYTIELSTGERKIIANFNGINSAPAFSPDGKSLVMALSLGDSSSTNLYLYDLASQHLKKLTHHGTNTSPSFSPDGESIIFNSDRAGSPQLYLLNLKDLSIRLISHEGIQNFSPVFLPSSQDIVFMHQETSGGPINIAVMNLESNAMRVLTHGGLDKSPSPAPNGKMVLYSNFDQERGVLAEVSIDGKLQAKLPAASGSVQSPAWSPFLN